MVVLFVGLKMFRQVFYSGAEKSNLDFRRTRVYLMQSKIVNYVLSFFRIQHRFISSLKLVVTNNLIISILTVAGKFCLSSCRFAPA